MANYRVLSTDEDLLIAVSALASGVGPIAIDSERASGFRYSQRAYLIQLHREGAGTFLIDPINMSTLAPLAAVIDSVEWILHAASQDLPCLRDAGLNPQIIFDTELASRLLGMPRVGLGYVVEDLLGIALAKEHSAADWSTRPLPEAWLEYAALDVEYLIPIRAKIIDLLKKTGKTDIARQEFEATLNHKLKAARAEPWRRLTGLTSIRNPRQLAVARELWLARDTTARDRDIAPGRLVPDASLTAVAKILPRSRNDLIALPEFKGRTSRSDSHIWWAAIERGIACTDLPALKEPREGPPPARSWGNRDVDADIRLKKGREAIAIIAESVSVPPENLLTPEILRRIAWRPPQPITGNTINERLLADEARQWQRELVSEAIAEAFNAADAEPREVNAPKSSTDEKLANRTITTETNNSSQSGVP